MTRDPQAAQGVDDYIAGFPPDVQEVLQKVRLSARTAAPGATEDITYDMPTLVLDGRKLVHFAGWKQHVSIYPVPPADEDFARELAPYLSGQGTLKFPLAKPVPYDLIERVVAALVAART